MKFNFKKIASVLAGTVMLSSTVALAAASTLPAPFVQNGEGDVLVVYGSNPLASSTDMAAATEIQAYLTSKITKTTTTTDTTDTTVQGGDFVELNKDNNKFNLGEDLNDIYSTLDEDELSTVLKPSVYEDDDGTEYDYTQKMVLGSVALSHFADDDVDEDEKPVIGFSIPSGTVLMNYTLDFTDKPTNQTSLLETTYLEMLGRTYYISDYSGGEMTLLDTANSATVTEGETTSVDVGDQKYEISIVSVDDASPGKATLMVNGKKVDSTNVGNSRKIAEDTYLSILDVSEAAYAGDQEWVEFSIGTGQIVLTDGAALEVNEETVSDVMVYIDESATELNSIKLDWIPEDDEFIVPEMELVFPGFESIKLSMAEFVTPDPEEISVKNNGDDYMEITGLKVKDGSVGSFPILYSSASKTNFTGLGKDSTHKLLTNATASPSLYLDEDDNPKFVATYTSGDDWETYLLELVSINEVDSGVHNETKIKNLANGEIYTFTDGDDKDLGEITLTTSAVSGDGENATIRLSSNAVADRIVTEEGLTIRLPIENTLLSSAVSPEIYVGAENATNPADTTWQMIFREADEDNNVNDDGILFNLTLGHTTSYGPQVSGKTVTTLEVVSGSDDEEGYVSGANGHATKLLWKTGGDNDVMDIEYHGGEAYAKVFVSEASVTVGGGSGGGGSSGSLLAMDSEVTSTTSKNLVVVGGSCVNTVAASLLGVSYPACGSDWQSATNVGAGSYLIQTFSRSGGKVATLVAGYNAGDTTNAAKAFTTLTNVDISAGKKYTGTTATTVTPVVA